MKDHFNWAKEQGFIPVWWHKLPERSANEGEAKEREQKESQEASRQATEA